MRGPTIPQAKWDEALVLYAQGVKLDEIQARTAIAKQAIISKAKRQGWTTIKANTRESTSEALNSILREADFRFRSALARRLQRLADSLPEKSLSLTKELALQQSLEPALRNAKTIFQWSASDSSKPLVRINVLGTATVAASTPEPPKESLSTTPTTPTGGP